MLFGSSVYASTEETEDTEKDKHGDTEALELKKEKEKL
jgi:hypothetical protein